MTKSNLPESSIWSRRHKLFVPSTLSNYAKKCLFFLNKENPPLFLCVTYTHKQTQLAGFTLSLCGLTEPARLPCLLLLGEIGHRHPFSVYTQFMHASGGGRHRDRRAERNAAISIYWLNTPSTLQHFTADREMQKGKEISGKRSERRNTVGILIG